MLRKMFKHKIQGVEPVYDHYDHYDERKEALDKLSNSIVKIAN